MSCASCQPSRGCSHHCGRSWARASPSPGVATRWPCHPVWILFSGLGQSTHTSCFHPFSKVMSAVGLLASCPSPDIEDLGRGLQGNLCRCTGYRPILSSLANLCSTTERRVNGQKGLISLNSEAEIRRAEADSTELELDSTTQVPISLL